MTAFTTPITWTAGQTVTATSLNAQLRDNMLHASEIQTYTPTLTQGAAVTKTVNYARYWQTGKRVQAQVFLSVTATGTASVQVAVSLPVTAAAVVPLSMALGSGWIYDASPTPTLYQGAVLLATTTTAALRIDGSTNNVGAFPSFALGSGDIVTFSFDYEAA